jgi:hypothetical protein
MTWGNNNAGPVGVQPFAPGQVGQPPGQAGANLPPFYATSFESLMAAVSRGEISLNQLVPATQTGGVGNANGNPTLLNALSSALPQNGTNGLNGVAAGGGTVNSSMASCAAPQNAAQLAANKNFGGAVVMDPKQLCSDATAALASPIQYGGN